MELIVQCCVLRATCSTLLANQANCHLGQHLPVMQYKFSKKVVDIKLIIISHLMVETRIVSSFHNSLVYTFPIDPNQCKCYNCFVVSVIAHNHHDHC